MAKFKVRVRDREWIEERVRPAVRKHMINKALSNPKITNKLRDFSLRNKAIQKEFDRVNDLRDKLHSDIEKFNDTIQDKHLGIRDYRYVSNDSFNLEWFNPELWSTVKDTVMFNAEDNLSVTSLVKLESISLQDAIAKIEKLS